VSSLALGFASGFAFFVLFFYFFFAGDLGITCYVIIVVQVKRLKYRVKVCSNSSINLLECVEEMVIHGTCAEIKRKREETRREEGEERAGFNVERKNRPGTYRSFVFPFAAGRL
jgi:hypothetical protein